MVRSRGEAAARDTAADMAEDLDGLIGERDQMVTLLDRTAAMRELSVRMRRATGTDLAYVADVGAPDLLIMRAWTGTRGNSLHGLEVPRGFGLGGKSFAAVQPFWVEDYCASPGITHDFDRQIREEGIGGMLAVPMIYDGEVLGVAYAAIRRVGTFGTAPIDAVKNLCDEAAVAMHASDRAQAQTGAAVAAERRRVSIALHDSVGAMLFSIGAEVRTLSGAADLSQPVLERLQSLEQHISAAASALRESLAALNDSAPAERLAAAITGDCRAFERRTGLPARTITLNDIPELEQARYEALEGAVREALLNVEKHASATSVVVSLVAVDAGVAVAVADDGVGWAPASEQALEALRPGWLSSGLGLEATLERLQRVGGRLSLVGNDDGGMTMRAWVPCL